MSELKSDPLPGPKHGADTIVIETTTIACDGDGPSGHPRVYLNLENRRAIDCPYCGRHFVLKEGAASASH